MRSAIYGLMSLALVLGAPAASADELDGLEMDVMDAEGTPSDASTKVLALPEQASDEARENAQRGLDTANRARENGRAFGEETAETARRGGLGGSDSGEKGNGQAPPDNVPGRP